MFSCLRADRQIISFVRRGGQMVQREQPARAKVIDGLVLREGE